MRFPKLHVAAVMLAILPYVPALAENWAAWVKAWDTLDDGPLAVLNERAARGEPAALTLCGERDWVRLQAAPGSLLRRARALLSAPSPVKLLETL